MDMDLHSGGESSVTGRYSDATAEFRQACGTLALGQMVHPHSFTLNDTMACLAIGDARMDSGVDPLPTHLMPESDRTTSSPIPAFDPQAQHTPQEILWIIDRLFACQVAYHGGAQLSQTLFTSLHFHTLHEQRQQQDIWNDALRVYVLALVKCCDMVWYEMTRGNLAEGEDVITDTCQMDMYQHVPVGYVLGQLQGLMAAFRDRQGVDEEERECGRAMLIRLVLIRQTTMILALFHEALTPSAEDAVPPAVLFQQVHNLCSQSSKLLDKLATPHPSTSLREPALKHAPTPQAASSFDPLYARRLENAGGVPPRPAELSSPAELVAFWRSHLDSWKQAVGVYAAVTGDGTTHDVSSGGWEAIETLCDTAGVLCEERPNSPYMRSLRQTCLCPPSNPHPSFLIDFLSSPTRSRTSIQRTLHTPCHPTLQTSYSYWQSKADSLLSSHILNSMSNRPRQKRHLARSFDRWRAFVRETDELAARFEANSAIPQQILHPFKIQAQIQSLRIALTLILSGFDLHLYSAEEYSTAYWLGIQIASECMEVRGEDNDPYLALLTRTLHAWYHLSLLSDVRTRRSTTLRHTNFFKRFKWLVLPPPTPAKDRYSDLNSLWEESEAEQRRVGVVDAQEVVAELRELVGDVDEVAGMVQDRLTPDANRWHLCRADAHGLLQRLRHSIQLTIQHLSVDATHRTFQQPSNESHPWFPPLVSS